MWPCMASARNVHKALNERHTQHVWLFYLHPFKDFTP